MPVFRFFVGRDSSSVSFMVESGVLYEDAEPVSVSNASRNLETPEKLGRLLLFPLAMMIVKDESTDRTPPTPHFVLVFTPTLSHTLHTIRRL